MYMISILGIGGHASDYGRGDCRQFGETEYTQMQRGVTDQ